MKKFGSLLLCLILISTLLITAAYATKTDFTAIPTTAVVVVNGHFTYFEAYNIEGYNYFKLRDLAFALGDTDKGFEVIWNEGINSVELIPNASYTPVGGEMEKKNYDSPALTVHKSTTSIYLDNEELELSAYNINGNNFFKLRDILAVFDIYVFWDETVGTIYVDSFGQKEVEVSTAAEFIQAVESNTIIRLNPGIYDFTIVNDVFPLGYKIYGVNNLTIIGAGADKTEFINTDRFMRIMCFENCRNISISGVKAGHTPQEYECDAGVFYFSDCRDVTVSDCYLYGCGSIGVSISSCTYVSVDNTVITDCSFLAVRIIDSINVVFSNCSIIENRGYASVISVSSDSRASQAEFNQCDISGNYNLAWEFIQASRRYGTSLTFNDCIIADNMRANGYNPAFFNIGEGAVIFNRCTFKNNTMGYMYTNYSPIFTECEFDGNIYELQ